MTDTVSSTRDRSAVVESLAKRFDVDVDTLREDLAQLEREVVGYALREVRLARGVTQRELAQRLGVSQNRISAIEKGQFHKAQLGTISRYVEALGGELIVQAQINGQSIRLS